MTYAICVGLFAVIRFANDEWIVGVFDSILALFGLYVFFLVYKTRNADLPAYAIAIISIIGTIATIILKGTTQVYWAYPSVALVFYLLPPKHGILMWSISAVIILFLIRDLPLIQLISISMTLFITSFFCYFFAAKMEQQHIRLRKIANEDVLTGTLNRRAFNQATEALKGSDKPQSGILFDLDNFKQVNDYFGHATGDQVLEKSVEFVAAMLKKEDQFFRIGGDEFAILCKDRDFDYAYKLALEVHQAFSRSEIKQQHHLTLSMSVAQKEPDEDIIEWLNRLDSAMYHAKKSGRNQIIKAIRH
ncbi:GGDEF domain-containing protein [Marinicella sp. S1101]|uniref:GGDEF domain-containing protein n=1 Tax=Marinicella marina TaxID=2996016 RepID=UPI0022609720|nr:GGDEF domain-containing protein [Marinicella marina]MCX7553490.1 GGDEF domain-containing protein [Marinicella marina]MDJ1140114.1 GGDEF domain-containing protein [Marinicella marina]